MADLSPNSQTYADLPMQFARTPRALIVAASAHGTRPAQSPTTD